MSTSVRTATDIRSFHVDKTMKAVRAHKRGGPEVLRYEDAPVPEVGASEVLVEVSAAGRDRSPREH